jgi:hypothetical protein
MVKGVLVVLVLSFCLYNAMERYITRKHYTKTEAWPVVEGEVTAAKPEHTNNFLLSRNCDFPKVEFKYTVNGTAYEGDNIKLGWACPSAEATFGVTAQYAPGKKLNVHYDPQDPSHSAALAVTYVATTSTITRWFVFSGLIALGFVRLLVKQRNAS